MMRLPSAWDVSPDDSAAVVYWKWRTRRAETFLHVVALAVAILAFTAGAATSLYIRIGGA